MENVEKIMEGREDETQSKSIDTMIHDTYNTMRGNEHTKRKVRVRTQMSNVINKGKSRTEDLDLEC